MLVPEYRFNPSLFYLYENEEPAKARAESSAWGITDTETGKFYPFSSTDSTWPLGLPIQATETVQEEKEITIDINIQIKGRKFKNL